MVCEILSIGTELLMGQILNSDAQYLSIRLPALGIGVYRHVTVGDNPGRIREALREALERAELVITTGGLGPTEDDLTKQMVADALGLPMELHQPSADAIAGFFERIGRTMTENNMRQAYFPRGAHIMPNRKGTAPGCVVERGGKLVAVLPGPPHELSDMFEQQLEPFLHARQSDVIVSKYLHIFGIGESETETRLSDIFSGTNPTAALYCSPGNVMLRLTARCRQAEEAGALIGPVEALVRQRLGESVYGEGLNASLARCVVGKLLEKRETLAVAESLTGGMLTSMLVDIEGASGTLMEGHLTYSNESKRRVLGVSDTTLATRGAVSEETAREMATGARERAGTDWAISTTGIAGPGGATDTKPVGLCYISVAGAKGVWSRELRLHGDRARVRLMCTLNALFLLYSRIGE